MLTSEERSSLGRRNKLRGAAKERKVANFLRTWHYAVVKSGGSLGPVDLIAIPVGTTQTLIRGIQVKSSYPSKEEMEKYENFAKILPSTVRFEVWIIPFSKRIAEREVLTFNKLDEIWTSSLQQR